MSFTLGADAGREKISMDLILPTYMPGNYIEQMVGSIVSNIEALKSYEISVRLLVILNGPKEPYYSYLISLLSYYSSINVEIIYTECASVSHARNIGIDKSEHTDFVLFIDDDDVLSGNYLPNLFSMWDGKNSTVVQSNTAVLSCESDSVKDHYIGKFISQRLRDGAGHYSSFSYRKLLNSVCGKLICRGLIGGLRFDESVRISEDALFLFTLSPKIKEMAFAPEAVYQVRERPGSASRMHKPVSTLARESLLFIRKVSHMYWKNPFEYSLLLYISRVLASVKFLIMRIIRL